MSKQYMTIRNNYGDKTVTIRTNSDKAIKNALGKIQSYSNGTVKSFVIKGDVIEFEVTSQKEKYGFWEPTKTRRAVIVENTFAAEETAEVVEAPAAEVIEAPAAETPDTTPPTAGRRPDADRTERAALASMFCWNMALEADTKRRRAIDAGDDEGAKRWLTTVAHYLKNYARLQYGDK